MFCPGQTSGGTLLSTGFTGALRRTERELTKRTSIAWAIAGIVTATGLVLADHDARRTVLVVVSTLGLFTAGVGFLLRWRLTSTAATRQIGVGLLLLGLHQPVAVALNAVLDHQLPSVSSAAGLGVVLVAAGVTLRAFPCRGLPPVWRLSRGAGALLAAVGVTALLIVASPLVPSVTGAPAVLAGAAWLGVAVAAWRSEPLAACERTPARALAGIALLVFLSTTARDVEVWLPATTGASRVVVGLGLVAAAAAACLTALHRLTAALAGQERYVAGLLEQLTGHERQLQQARACLHDARATVAGVRAASSAVRHLDRHDPEQAATHADLVESVAVELARLERMLRLPERTPSVSCVDVDQVVRALVVSHRERGLRISWAPTGAAPVTVDGDALAVILGNLLANALSHAPRALCRVDVTIADRLTVTVADDGPGLSPAGRAAAFEAGTRRSGSPGEGLGLAISRDLARRHGGELAAVDSVVGTSFVLTLPVQQVPRPNAVPQPRAGSGAALGAAR
jgi:signal transduction histidine kinase